VSFEIRDEWRKEFKENRSNPCMGDALSFNYISYFEENNFPKQIDFLQVDIDAGYDDLGQPVGNPYLKLHGLLAVPLKQYRFSMVYKNNNKKGEQVRFSLKLKAYNEQGDWLHTETKRFLTR
jgi:hypothetical protein